MQKIKFTKMVASGNDFVIIEGTSKPQFASKILLARNICDRKYGAGADGLLFLEKSGIADARMRIFNADGSEAEMCGNGARCVTLYTSSQLPTHSSQKKFKIQTKAGIIESEVKAGKVKIKLTDPRDIRLNLPLKINNKTLHVNFINTGVPHTVIFVEGLDKIDIVNLGREVRYHERFIPAGTNVDFVEALNSRAIRVRTYERGVEDETLACGTGAVASALIAVHSSRLTVHSEMDVHTRSGEILKVYFKKEDNNFKDIWLEGKVRKVYTGVYYV